MPIPRRPPKFEIEAFLPCGGGGRNVHFMSVVVCARERGLARHIYIPCCIAACCVCGGVLRPSESQPLTTPCQRRTPTPAISHLHAHAAPFNSSALCQYCIPVRPSFHLHPLQLLPEAERAEAAPPPFPPPPPRPPRAPPPPPPPPPPGLSCGWVVPLCGWVVNPTHTKYIVPCGWVGGPTQRKKSTWAGGWFGMFSPPPPPPQDQIGIFPIYSVLLPAATVHLWGHLSGRIRGSAPE